MLTTCGACAHVMETCKISPDMNVTEKSKRGARSHEKETSRWLFLRQSALPTTGRAYVRALLPLHGLSEAHRERICYQCDHRNFGHKDHARGAGGHPGSPCLWSTR